MTLRTLIKSYPEITQNSVTYRHGATGIKYKRKGFDIKLKDETIAIVEPCYYSNGDKWFVSSKGVLKRYYKNRANIYKDIFEHLKNQK